MNRDNRKASDITSSTDIKNALITAEMEAQEHKGSKKGSDTKTGSKERINFTNSTEALNNFNLFPAKSKVRYVTADTPSRYSTIEGNSHKRERTSTVWMPK
jgi:hypothetical protein